MENIVPVRFVKNEIHYRKVFRNFFFDIFSLSSFLNMNRNPMYLCETIYNKTPGYHRDVLLPPILLEAFETDESVKK